MTSREFCYWLQGYIELLAADGAAATPGCSANQMECIKKHLALVFVHEIDPSAGGPAEQAKLDAIHAGVTKEEMEAAIAEAVSKLPKPGSHGGFGPAMRC